MQAFQHVRPTPQCCHTLGRYLTPDGHDLTGQSASWGHLQIHPQHSAFVVRADGGAACRGLTHWVNLLRQRAGWTWQQPPDVAPSRLISVQQRQQHHYALALTFESGLHLIRLTARSEPRLRPRAHGDLHFGQIIGTIRLRGRERAVWDRLTIRPAAAR